MCQMWDKIRYGVRWKPNLRLRLACRALDLKNVKSVHVSMDPLYKDNGALSEFWYRITEPTVKSTNPRLRITSSIRSDGNPPYFVAQLADSRNVVFKTEGLLSSDVIIRLNRILGNPELGKLGESPDGTWLDDIHEYD